MAGLDPAIHALQHRTKNVDARDKPGHDDLSKMPICGYANASAGRDRDGAVRSERARQAAGCGVARPSLRGLAEAIRHVYLSRVVS
ncbi:hypothetical protein E4K65_39425 [Bradyrhizobium niftali]|uniref:Uncharacterized protein n=1 Tax=Bradyrhizobium niftali TaxID=2560055 RepID=A0A4Y9LA22_9BRAD|nr:hypothetical protein E4K65_39425 [Bradyrhizobium niftali]